MRAQEVTRNLLDWFDSDGFKERYVNDAVFRNTVDTLTKALGVAAELLHEAKVWMEDDGSEPLPIGTGSRIGRFLTNLPKSKATAESKEGAE